tara:strand:+ start:4206 stop:8543 length:4338 start_codon:yes stop_codon:yes gene_type:complete
MALPEEGNVSPFRPQPLSRPLTAADYMAYNPTIILNSEGSGNPGTAPTGLRKTSRVYYRKADLTDGAELKASFGDVNIGNSASCTVQGGPFKSIFYSTYNIPSKPKYGDANLVGLYAGVPVTNVERKTLSSLPNFNIWKGKETGITDGSCTVDETPIAAFMSHIDVAPNVYEGFDGGAGAVTGSTRRIGNRVVSHMDEYLPADWAWNNMQVGTRQGLDSYQDFLDRYCMQVDGVISGYACPVKQTSFSLLVSAGTILSPSRWGEVGNGVTTTYKPTLGRSATDLIEPVWDTISVHNAGYPLTEFTETVSEDVESTSDVNSNNSLFHVYSNNINAAAADDAPIFEASVKFSGEKVLSGAYSAKMRTYWSNSSISIGNMPDPKDSGATNRQEVVMQYGPLPCPTVLDMESSGQNETAYRISFDLYIDKLAAAWSGGSGVGEDRLTRGFIVTLSDTQYTRDNGTLYDWIKEKDNNTSEFAYFAILNSSQDSANAADADHSIYIVGSNQHHLADSSSNFDEDATNKMIRLNAVDPFETAGLNHTQASGLPAGQWIHFDIATIPYLYGYRLRATTPTPNGSENVLSAFQLRTTDNSRQSDPANWTPYIQFWLVNYPSDHSNDNAYAAAQDVESVVFMDNFQISNANYTLENATICEENISTKSKLTFGTNKARDETNGTHDSARILSLGFQEVDDFPDGTLKNLMFSTFSSTDINDTGTLHSSYAKMAWSAYSTANASHLKLGWPMGNDANGENDVDATYAFTDGSSPEIGLTLGGTIGSLAPDAGTGTEVAWTGGTAVEGFSQKGLLQVSFDDSTYANFTKTRRENHFVKARVLKIVEQSSGQTQFLVDNPEIFRLPSTQHTGYVTTYRLYLHNENYKTDGNPNTSMRDMTLKSIEGNLVTLKGNSLTDAGGTDLAITDNLAQLCISPVMYWLCMYYKWHDNTDNMPDRYYNSVHNVNSGVAAGISSGNYGATWNEHKFTDAATYDNGWTWGKSETSNLVISTDYGFGAYDTETKQGGYCGKFNPSAVSPTGSATTGTRFNIVDVSGIVTVDDAQPESTIALAITPEEDLLEHKMTIDTDEASAGQRPFVLAAFMDSVAPPPQLSVIPYENDPTKYEFQWSASGKDYWYGFIIIDKEPILNKYHKVGMHIPNFFTLANYDGNVDYASGTSSRLKYYNYPENQERDLELDSTFSIDFEGICGITPKFDGDAYIRADADHMEIEDPGSPAPPTTNATFMAHVRISELPSSGTDEIVTISDNSGNVAFELEIGTTGILTATVAPGSGTAVALTSTKQLIPDNESPTSVIVTLDTELEVGNVKLFIDGRLEDQSGLRTAAGSAENWKTGQSLDDPSNGYVYLGNNDSNDGFHGTIEEFVVSHRTYYPVVVSDGKFVLDKPLKELVEDSSGISQSYSARLFLCDYHNISGKTASEISTSAPVSMRKTAFRLRGD